MIGCCAVVVGFPGAIDFVADAPVMKSKRCRVIEAKKILAIVRCKRAVVREALAQSLDFPPVHIHPGAVGGVPLLAGADDGVVRRRAIQIRQLRRRRLLRACGSVVDGDISSRSCAAIKSRLLAVERGAGIVDVKMPILINR